VLPEMRRSPTSASVAGCGRFRRVRSIVCDVARSRPFWKRLSGTDREARLYPGQAIIIRCPPLSLALLHRLPSHRMGQVCSRKWAGRRMDCPLLDGIVG